MPHFDAVQRGGETTFFFFFCEWTNCVDVAHRGVKRAPLFGLEWQVQEGGGVRSTQGCSVGLFFAHFKTTNRLFEICCVDSTDPIHLVVAIKFHRDAL